MKSHHAFLLGCDANLTIQANVGAVGQLLRFCASDVSNVDSDAHGNQSFTSGGADSIVPI